MRYREVKEARFLERPNRFIARVMLDGKVETVHVKNTGRCRELLLPDSTVYLAYDPSPLRKTDYDLIAVRKGERLINIDAQAPNAVFAEWMQERHGQVSLWPEYTYGDSRFDFRLDTEAGMQLVEVKGVTLEDGGHVAFPDAPTERGTKHLHGLAAAARAGIPSAIFFVIQMEGVLDLVPADWIDPAFAAALREARDAGVRIEAYDCCVKENSLSLRSPVPVLLP